MARSRKLFVDINYVFMSRIDGIFIVKRSEPKRDRGAESKTLIDSCSER
jgi:hypothetical protein